MRDERKQSRLTEHANARRLFTAKMLDRNKGGAVASVVVDNAGDGVVCGIGRASKGSELEGSRVPQSFHPIIAPKRIPLRISEALNSCPMLQQITARTKPENTTTEAGTASYAGGGGGRLLLGPCPGPSSGVPAGAGGGGGYLSSGPIGSYSSPYSSSS